MKFLAPPWPTPSPEHTRERAVLCVRVHVHAPASSSNDKDRKTKKQSAVETREDDHRRVHVGKQDVPCTHVGHCMCMHARANLLLFLSLNSARHVSLCAECVVYAACPRAGVALCRGLVVKHTANLLFVESPCFICWVFSSRHMGNDSFAELIWVAW